MDIGKPYFGPLFTKRIDVLPRDLVKTRGRDIRIYTFSMTVKLDKPPGSSAADMPVTFQSDTVIITSNLSASRLHEIWR